MKAARLSSVLVPLTFFVSIFAFVAQASAQTPQRQQMHRGEKHTVKRQVEAVEERWRMAVIHADKAELNAVLADDLSFVAPSGMLQTKEQMIDNLVSGRLHMTSLEIVERKIRIYGRTAVVDILAETEGTNDSGPFHNHVRYNQVFVRNDKGQWQMVSFEANRVREPGEKR